MKQSSRSQLETIRIDLPDRSFAFDNVGNRIRIQRYDFRFLPSRFLGALHARFIARTWEISGLAACRASLIKVYGRIVECKRLPAGGNFICAPPEGTRAITAPFVTGCESPLFDTLSILILFFPRFFEKRGKRSVSSTRSLLPICGLINRNKGMGWFLSIELTESSRDGVDGRCETI